MGGFMLKVKTKLGQHVVSNMTPDETVGNLKLTLSELTSIPAEGLNVLIGFPPKPLDLSANEILLSDTLIRNGDTLIVEEKSIPDVVPQQHRNNLQLEEDILLAQRLANQGEESAPCLGSQGILLKQVVPSDNSCLFTSIGELLILFLNMTHTNLNCILIFTIKIYSSNFLRLGYVMNGKIDTEIHSYLREIIAQHVSNDKVCSLFWFQVPNKNECILQFLRTEPKKFYLIFKETYNEAMLGRPNAEYCEWIRKPASWGGAIEVSILANYYGIEIDVVDITNALINRFGEDKEYGMRVFLLFDGIHYDPLYLESITVS